MNIIIVEHESRQPNGDRDTRRHPCFKYEVVLINGERRKILFTCDQYDSYHCHINGTKAEYRSKAQKEAADWSNVLYCDADLVPMPAPHPLEPGVYTVKLTGWRAGPDGAPTPILDLSTAKRVEE